MSTETLTKPDVDSAADFKAWETEMAVGRKKDLGAAACSGCVFMAMGCPGKKESAPNCPPEAEKIQEKEIRAALFDDRVASVSIDGSGGFVAIPEKANKLQTPVALPSKPKLRKVAKKPVAVLKKIPQPERTRNEKGSGFLAMLGELALMFFGGTPTAPAKK